MRNGPKILFIILATYAGIVILHLWLNIGFDKLNIVASEKSAEAPFRVGFLPVT